MNPASRHPQGIDEFASLLRKVGLDLGAEDMVDALWLAAQMGEVLEPREAESATTKEAPSSSIKLREEVVEDEDETEDEGEQLPLRLPPTQSAGQETSKQPVDGIPIKAPAAPALRIRLELARALRPLRRTVPSPVQASFDEEATVAQIADQGLWSPVLTPAPERWLDLELVVEETRSTPIWRETIAEFETLAERQGAFRTVNTWRLTANAAKQLELFPSWRGVSQPQRPRSYRELWDPAGRRLVLIMSDCTSEMWRQGQIHLWLEKLGKRSPTVVIQLLPERLWSQSGLGMGLPVWLSSSEPGKPNAKLKVQQRMPFWQLLGPSESKTKPRITIPVSTLEAEPLKQWAKMIAEAGGNQAAGIQFDLDLMGISPPQESGEPAKIGSREKAESDQANQASGQVALSAAERVQRFRATASLMAQRLAGLMAAAPVSPPIVHLIRQTLLPKAEPVHVAEVFMGGLMEVKGQADAKTTSFASVQYDFAKGVRDLLMQAVSIPQTESVLDAVSRYIAEHIGLSAKSFEALLAIDFKADPEKEEIVLPFAQIATQVLRRMGGDYAAIAHRLETAPKVSPPPKEPNPDDLFPLLQTYTFREATISFASERVEISAEEIEAEIERYGLTPRQAEVWRLRQQGYEYSEIANQLFISVNTVEKHLKNIQVKRDLVAALGEGVRTGFFEFETALIGKQEKPTEPKNIEQILTALDLLLLNQEPPQRLKSVQKDILRGAWEGQTYEEIADRIHTKSKSLKKQGTQLWQLLSKALGENVTKSNLHNVLTRWAAQTDDSGLDLRLSQRQAWQFIEDLGNGIELEMVSISGGSFMMGSPEGEAGRTEDEGPQHPVTIPLFFISKYPITQAQWRAVERLPRVNRELAANPSEFKGEEENDHHPVERITWYDAVEFCDRLSAFTNRQYRLPSEAEWEYACRAGTETPFCFGETLTTDLANYHGEYTYGQGSEGEYRGKTTPVGSFPANAFGLYDMHGNVWEWCADHWHGSYENAPSDGTIWSSSDEEDDRLLRGGSWNYSPENCRSAVRYWYLPVYRSGNWGLRVVCAAART